MKPLTGAQSALVEAMKGGAALRVERMSGRHKSQARIYRADTGDDVTSIANALRERGFVRDDYTLAKAGRHFDAAKNREEREAYDAGRR